MTDNVIDQRQLSRSYNRCSLNGALEVAQAAKVQWAARRAVNALERLHLELSIADAKRMSRMESEAAKRHAKLVRELEKLRKTAEAF